MANLVLHVGPGKCGSTSIQQFFSSHENPCEQRVRYQLLDVLKIHALRSEVPDAPMLAEFAKVLADNLRQCDALVLSHEYLFSSPHAIKRLCDLAKGQAATISIVGYSRRQSEFLVSAYSQWLFRSSERTEETTQVLKELGLDPMLFLGMERQLIASVANDFHSARQLSDYSLLDWNDGYRRISRLVDGSGAVIKCGTLPKEGPALRLVEDFCEKSGLTLREEVKTEGWRIDNVSFHPDLVEAVGHAVSLGLQMPGTHELNWALQSLSAGMVGKPDSSKFLSDLKSYADCFYWESNKQLCREYDLDETYFTPLASLSKEEILSLIVREGEKRAADPSAAIACARGLSARLVELCLTLAKKT